VTVVKFNLHFVNISKISKNLFILKDIFHILHSICTKNIFFQNQLISNIIIGIYVTRVQNITFLYKWEVYTHERDDFKIRIRLIQFSTVYYVSDQLKIKS
jgi:hypothetical protein